MINWSWLWEEWIRPFGSAIILAFFIIVFVAQSFKVEGSSMKNTLYDAERLMVDKLTYRFREPRRGEVIVLRVPGSKYIKRIIAIGGDNIQEINGVVMVNGKTIDEPYVDNKTKMTWGPFSVPEGHVWVMGDNRPRSDDSRGSVGFLPTKNIVGRALFRYWPLTKIGVL